MTMMKLVCALGVGSVLVFSAGCGKSKALLAVEAYEKDTCACKDAACVSAAAKKFADNAKDMASASGGETDAIAKATAAATNCALKASMAGIPGMPAMPGMPKN